MNPFLKFFFFSFLKLYVISFIVLNIVFILILYILEKLQIDLSWVMFLAFLAFIFSVILNLTLGTLHFVMVKRMHPDNVQEALKVSHIRNIELHIPYNKVFNICHKAIKSIKRCEIKEQNSYEGIIEAIVGANWKTWGDKILVKIIKIDSIRTRIEILSEPIIPFTIFDYGKNMQNVEIIIKYLKEKKSIFR